MKTNNLCYIEQEKVYLSDVEIAEMLITGRSLEMCTKKPLYRVPDIMYRLGGNIWIRENVRYINDGPGEREYHAYCISPVVSLYVTLLDQKITALSKGHFVKGLYYFIDDDGHTRKICSAQDVIIYD